MATSLHPLPCGDSSQGKEITVLCRFISNVLVKEEVDFREAKYIAFSHVWGHAQWANVEGIADDVLVSPSKARFLQTHLQELVGSAYFWIDILCIDQRNAESRIAVTRIIPELYNLAQETIVIRDGRGFKSCCAEAFGQLSTWSEYRSGCRRWGEHWSKMHRHMQVKEGILDRLWPLQESILSNTLRFVTIEESSERMSILKSLAGGMHEAIYTTVDGLWMLSRAWAAYGRSGRISDQEQLSFMFALINNGEVSRAVVGRSPFSTDIGHEFSIQSNSTRRTSKARDFILSTMLQYDWYKAPSPQEVRQMSFAALYRDCYTQARAADRAILPRITAGMVGESNRPLVTENIPEPECLGDFVKLFGLASECAPKHEQDCATGIDLGLVEIHTIDTSNMASVLAILENSFDFSRNTWVLAEKGELVGTGSWPDASAFRPDVDDDTAQRNARQFLSIKLNWFLREGGARMDALSFQRDLIEANPSNYAMILIRLGALISCGIGISGSEWSRNLLTPVLVRVGQHALLSLISSAEPTPYESLHLAHPLDSSLQLTYKHFVITHPSGDHKPLHRCVGLLPSFTHETDTAESFLRRRKELSFPDDMLGLMVNLG